MVKGARSKKANLRSNLFFPLNLLQIEAYYRPNASLQRMKEAFHQPLFSTIYTDPVKSAVVFFLAEVLYRIVPADHYNPELFDFVYDAMILYDSMVADYQNFHLIFLIELLRYEGFSPTQNYSDENRVFSIQAARFLPSSMARLDDMSEEASKKFAQLLGCNFSNMHSIPLNAKERMYLLNKLIEYLQVHLHGFAPIKSLPVLHEVFRS
jgi:DNA repair protein RecO (recombination protein O)